MNTKIVKLKYVAWILLLGLISVCIVFASAGSTETVTEDSTIDIRFDPYDGVTNPVDPENPGTDSGATGTGANGPLSIDYISAITFDPATIVIEETTYRSTSTRPYVQVTDLRGVGTGWRLTAQASAFSAAGETTLPEATITLSGGRVNSAYINDIGNPVAEQNVVLTTGGTSQVVMRAAPGNGQGTWVDRFYDIDTSGGAPIDVNNVLLTIPLGASSVGTHTSTITWSLVDAP